MRKLVLVLFGCVLVWSFSSTLEPLAAQETASSQEIREGTWLGSLTRPNGSAMGVTFEVKKVPDPHSRWRPGKGELLSITATFSRGFLGSVPLSNIRLESETLSFWIPFRKLACSLRLEQGGDYAGECTGADGLAGALIMSPPLT